MIYHYTCKFKDYQMPLHGDRFSESDGDTENENDC